MKVSLEKSLTRLLLMIVVFVVCLASSQRCQAQIVPDTTYNDVTRDTTGVKGPKAGTWQVVNSPATADTTKTNTAALPTDTIPVTPVKEGPFQPNPKKAGMYSAILPGLGQLYNKQYWKVPVVYAGLAVATYFIVENLTNYQSYRQAYVNRINNPNYIDQYTNIYSESQLDQLQNDYSKYLDITVLITGIGYALQILDAVTAAHLKNFDISRDISMKMRPVVFPSGAGVGLVMNFKR
jgi:Family of unknown function (DUF5683)